MSRKIRYRGLVGIIVNAIALCACADDPVVFHNRPLISDEIVFLYAPDPAGSSATLHAIRPDGSNQRQLAPAPWWDVAPEVAPDGATIAFVRQLTTEPQEIYLMNGDGSGVRRLTHTSFYRIGGASWAPDGARLVYSAQDSTLNWDLYIVDTTTAVSTLVPIPRTSSSRRDYSTPAWSPNGAEIVFVKNDTLVWISPQGEVLRRAYFGVLASSPDWCSNGQSIAFTYIGAGIAEVDIAIIDRLGTGLKRLTHDNQINADPAWSPDCTRIAYRRSDGTGVGNLFVIDSAGSGTPAAITSGNGHAANPSWR